MGYYEGELNVFSGNGNNGNNGFWGGDGIWAILLLALLGNNGWGNGRGNYGAGNEFVGYELGKVATSNDVAAGFASQATLNSLNEIKLANAQGFAGLNTAIATGNAGIQQTLCQGFNGVNTAILQSANATERGFAQTGYNLASCCCELKGAIADLRFANEAQTCQIINAINAGNQRLVDIYTNDKIDTLNRKLAIAEGQISQANQTNVLLNAINKTPIPSYNVPNPYCCYTQANACCGCGF